MSQDPPCRCCLIAAKLPLFRKCTETSEIHRHLRSLFLIQLRDLRLHDSVDPLAHIQNAWSVRSYDDRSIRLSLYNITQHLPLCRHIKRTGRLIKQQNRRSGNNRSRDAELCA